MRYLQWPAQASALAVDVDRGFVVLGLVSTAVLLLIAGLIVGFCIRFRRSKQPRSLPTGNTSVALEVAWSLVTLLAFLAAFVWGARIYLRSQDNAPDNAYLVYAVGKQWMWKFQHSDGHREINELHVPSDRPVRIRMISQDVIHSLYFPAFRLKQDVLPVMFTEMWFQPNLPGTYPIFCAEYCGTSHAGMIGQVHVMDAAGFRNWLGTDQSQARNAANGLGLLHTLGCTSCHSSKPDAIGPPFTGLFGQTIELADGTKTSVDAAYIRESILHPEARLVKHYAAVMPSYEGRIKEEEILSITYAIQSQEPDHE